MSISETGCSGRPLQSWPSPCSSISGRGRHVCVCVCVCVCVQPHIITCKERTIFGNEQGVFDPRGQTRTQARLAAAQKPTLPCGTLRASERGREQAPGHRWGGRHALRLIPTGFATDWPLRKGKRARFLARKLKSTFVSKSRSGSDLPGLGLSCLQPRVCARLCSLRERQARRTLSPEAAS